MIDSVASGPWYQLLGDALDPPERLLAEQLWWAVTHDLRARVALLADNGVDVLSPLPGLRATGWNGATPAAIALLNGHRVLADQLVARGAEAPAFSAVEQFIAAAMAGDGVTVRAADAEVVSQARRTRPGLVTWAASLGFLETVSLLVAAGFDVNSFGRSDAPADDPWHTALHAAAEHGNLALAERLLELGADPRLRDRRFDSTPLGWARYFGHEQVADLLMEPVSEA